MNNKIRLFAAGRLCLFGEHSDWAGQARTMNADVEIGRAIVTGIEQGIFAEAYRSEKFCFIDKVSGIDNNSFSCEMDRGSLRKAAKCGGYYSYVCGVASYICEWYRVGGITVEIYDQTLPMKSGLSSSAAICVLIARAFNQLYDLHLNTEGIMNIAYLGEQRTPSRCGRLDQACAYGVIPVAMVFDGHEVDVERLTVKGEFHYVFADLMAEKNTVKILSDLNRGYPFASNEMERRLHEALGKDNLDITARAIICFSKGKVEELGKLMTEAQSVFDNKVAPMCPQELTAPVLHETLSDPEIKKLTYGGKGVGSQGDGTVQFLARDKQSQQRLYDYLKDVKGMTAYKLTLKSYSKIRKAVIPVAGFGTRLYPATRGIRKEFCPVLDDDGLVKPVLMVLLEELIKSGIEDICLVLCPREKEFYESFFHKQLSIEHYRSLPDEMKRYEDKFCRISEKIQFVFQEEQKGFGHAVYQANSFANGEPVVLLLGDTIYKSNIDIPCIQQLVQAFEVYGKSMVSLQKVKVSDVCNYGVFAGTWENKNRTILSIDRVSEKPTPQYAEEHLGTLEEGEETSFYGAFGSYIITKEVFSELERMCIDSVDSAKEIEFTEALEYVMKSSGLLGFIPDGNSYDMGNASAYSKAFTAKYK